MNILFLFSNLQQAVGGIPHYNRLLVGALGESVCGASDRLTTLALNDPSETTLAEPLRRQGFGENRSAFVRASIEAGRHADLVIFGHVNFAPLAFAMPRAKKCLIAHGIEVWKPLARWRVSGVRRMQQVWAVSHYTRDQLLLWSGLSPAQCHVLPNTLPPGDSVESTGERHRLGLPNGPLILTVSRLDARERYKNIDRLLDALVGLPGVTLVIVGEGTDRPRLQWLAKHNQVETRVRFAGGVSDALLAGYYKTCDVFALPSTREGFGIVYLEAMAHSKPCVGARAGGTPEVIHEGVTGRLVSPDNTDHLQAALRELLSDPRQAKKMGSAGRARFERQFSYPIFCQRLEELMAQLVDDRPAIQRMSA